MSASSVTIGGAAGTTPIGITLLSGGSIAAPAITLTAGNSGIALAGGASSLTYAGEQAGVPVVIKVVKGAVNCATALRIENEYAARLRDGQVAGNGGGAPVTMAGWTCQSYNTPDLLKTGDASQCHTGSATIVAVLPVPTPAAS